MDNYSNILDDIKKLLLGQMHLKANLEQLLVEWQDLVKSNDILRIENNRLRLKINSLQEQIGIEDEWEI